MSDETKEILRFTVKCPYCGTMNQTYVDSLSNPENMVVVCDIEEGGCDRYFAVVPHIRVVAEVYEMTEARP